MKHTQINQRPEGAKVRVISQHQRISFKGSEYDVFPLGLQVGDRVTVAESNVFNGEVCAYLETDVKPYVVALKKIIKDDWGFETDSPALGAKE